MQENTIEFIEQTLKLITAGIRQKNNQNYAVLLKF